MESQPRLPLQTAGACFPARCSETPLPRQVCEWGGGAWECKLGLSLPLLDAGILEAKGTWCVGPAQFSSSPQFQWASGALLREWARGGDRRGPEARLCPADQLRSLGDEWSRFYGPRAALLLPGIHLGSAEWSQTTRPTL